MKTTPRIFISHTTRDQRDYDIAHKLADGLLAREAEVYIAPNSIPAGSEWQSEIVSSIMEQCTHFLVILSAASTASERVLEEIELAKQRYEQDPAFSVLTLPVGDLGAFTGCDFISRFQKLPYHHELPAQLDAVLTAVGIGPVIHNPFRAVFQTLIEEKTKDFVGREYVFSAIEQFQATHSSGYFTIEGDPGVGKTTIAAEFVRRTGCVAYFNVQAQGITKVSQFLKSICGQLIDRYTLPYSSLPSDATQDGAFLARLLDEAAEISRRRSGERFVIVIDALDEVDLTVQAAGSNILYLPASLPEKVFLVTTRRQLNLPGVFHAPQSIFNLQQFHHETLQDIRTYIQRAAERSHVRVWIDSRGLTEEKFISTLVEKSGHNFMYLSYLISAIESGDYRDLDLRQLPSGLQAYYGDHWRRMGMMAKPAPQTKIKIVYILAEIQQPVSRRLIANFAQEDDLTVQEVLDEWSQFLHIKTTNGDVQYSIYHTSFRDFLHHKDIVQAAGVTFGEIHGRIADDLWKEFMENE